MEIGKYISELLFKNNCVVIPEFGGFIMHPTPSFQSLENQTFNPPSKLLAFNQKLQQNDGILVNYIMQQQGLKYEQALHQIKLYVARIKEELRNNEVFELAEVGKFYHSLDGALQFKPTSSINFDRDSFGLVPIHASPIIRFDMKVVEEIKKTETTKVRSESPKTRSINTKLVIQVAAAIALMIGMAWQFNSYNLSYSDLTLKNIENIQVSNVIENLLHNDLNINKDKIEQLRSKNNKEDVAVENVTSDDEHLEALKEDYSRLEAEYDNLNEKIKEVNKVFTHKVKPVLKNAPPIEINKENYGAIYIIVGSFKDIENANKLAIQLKRKGYSITTLEAENGYIRVGIYDFYSVEEAKGTLEDVKESVTKYAWIAEASEMM